MASRERGVVESMRNEQVVREGLLNTDPTMSRDIQLLVRIYTDADDTKRRTLFERDARELATTRVDIDDANMYMGLYARSRTHEPEYRLQGFAFAMVDAEKREMRFGMMVTQDVALQPLYLSDLILFEVERWAIGQKMRRMIATETNDSGHYYLQFGYTQAMESKRAREQLYVKDLVGIEPHKHAFIRRARKRVQQINEKRGLLANVRTLTDDDVTTYISGLDDLNRTLVAKQRQLAAAKDHIHKLIADINSRIRESKSKTKTETKTKTIESMEDKEEFAPYSEYYARDTEEEDDETKRARRLVKRAQQYPRIGAPEKSRADFPPRTHDECSLTVTVMTRLVDAWIKAAHGYVANTHAALVFHVWADTRPPL